MPTPGNHEQESRCDHLMAGSAHVEAVGATIGAVVTRAPRDKHCAVPRGDGAPDRIPPWVEEAAHHASDPPRAEVGQDGLDICDDCGRRAAPQPVVVATLDDHDPRSGRRRRGQAGEHPGRGVATHAGVDDRAYA
jgi:hypothetical protein